MLTVSIVILLQILPSKDTKRKRRENPAPKKVHLSLPVHDFLMLEMYLVEAFNCFTMAGPRIASRGNAMCKMAERCIPYNQALITSLVYILIPSLKESSISYFPQVNHLSLWLLKKNKKKPISQVQTRFSPPAFIAAPA